MNILITSAGRRAYLIDYFKNVNGINKVYASNSVYTIALQHADDYLISPLIYSASYIASILQFCKEKKIQAVLSLFDADLLVLSKHKTEFEANGITLLVSNDNFVTTCNDKWETFNFLSVHEINTPKTYLHKEHIAHSISHNKLSYPIIIKPRWGTGSIGVHIAYSENELNVLSNICEREINNSYLKYESNITPNAPIIYQQYIPGTEYKLNILNDLNGDYVETFAIKKIAIRSGETDIGETVSNSLFVDIARKISQNSRHIGILSVDCIVSGDEIFVIEFNCRICGIYPILHLAGLNYPQILSDWLHKRETDTNLLKITTGIKVIKDIVPTILA